MSLVYSREEMIVNNPLYYFFDLRTKRKNQV